MNVPLTLKNLAMGCALGATNDEDGLKCVMKNKEFLLTLFRLADLEESDKSSEIAHKCLVNLSASQEGTESIELARPDVGEWLVSRLHNVECPFIEMKCMMLSNLTRYEAACVNVANYFANSFESFRKSMFLFLDLEMKGKYDYLAMLFGNLSSVVEGKRFFLNEDSPYLKYLLPYTVYYDSEIRRLGIAILLRNVCFEINYHKWLLEDIQVLPFLLLPLAGPENFDDDEMEKLPIDLQYLGDEKFREPNTYIRILLLESFFKLCATAYGRKYLRDNGTYYILRELHKWEKKPEAIKACDDVIEILIRDETDLSTENLMDVSIPQHLLEKFDNLTVTSYEIPSINV